MRALLIFFLIIGSLASGISYYVQYGMDISPCIYCKLQRWGYFLLIPLSIIGLRTKWKRGILRIIQCIFLLIFVMAGFHTFKELAGRTCACTLGTIKWEIFGVTASLYSGIFALILLILVQVIPRSDT